MTEDQERFELAAYEHYLTERNKRPIKDDCDVPLTREGLLWRQPSGDYGVLMFNAAWWAWRTRAALASPASAEPSKQQAQGAGARDAAHDLIVKLGLWNKRKEVYQLLDALATTAPESPAQVGASGAPSDAQINELRARHGITSNGRGIKEFTQIVAFVRDVLTLAAPPAAPRLASSDPEGHRQAIIDHEASQAVPSDEWCHCGEFPGNECLKCRLATKATEPAPASGAPSEDMQTTHWITLGGFFQRFNGEDHACLPLPAWRALMTLWRAFGESVLANQATAPGRHLDLCASQDDAMMRHPDCDCAALATKAPERAAEPADPTSQFLSAVEAELRSARAKFPGDRIMTIALAEEFGELAKAMLDESGENVWKEAVQTAVMAARVAIDGDSSVDEWRAAKGLDNHRCGGSHVVEEVGASGAPSEQHSSPEKAKWTDPVEHILRAMARNYGDGQHSWDHLDRAACLRAAEVIDGLRAQVATKATEPAPAPAAAVDANMWAVHIQGPDDIYAAPDREVADAVALVLNLQFKRHPLADDIHSAASVVLWPYGYETWSAAKDLLKLEVKGLSDDR